MRNKGIIVKLLVQGHLAMLRLMAGLECCFISLQILHEATFLEERGKRLGGGGWTKQKKWLEPVVFLSAASCYYRFPRKGVGVHSRLKAVYCHKALVPNSFGQILATIAETDSG